MCGMQQREPQDEISATAGRAHGSCERRHPSHDTAATHGRRWVSSAPGQGKRALQSDLIDRHHACVKLNVFGKFYAHTLPGGGKCAAAYPTASQPGAEASEEISSLSGALTPGPRKKDSNHTLPNQKMTALTKTQHTKTCAKKQPRDPKTTQRNVPYDYDPPDSRATSLLVLYGGDV